MQVEVRCRGLERSPAVVAEVHERAERILGRRADRLWQAVVLLEDVNGPRGGIDKRCAVHLSGPLGELVAEARDANLRKALDRALSAARRQVTRAADRRAEPQRSTPPADFTVDLNAGV